MTDHSAASITWTTQSPSPEIVARVREEIAKELQDLSAPASLIFHHMALTADWHGPAVILSGNTETGGFDAAYDEQSEPITFDLRDFPNLQEAIAKAEDDDPS